jgi:type II secretory pathway pseudopilin PulG
MRRGEPSPNRASQSGYTLVTLLVVVFLVSLGLSIAGPTWREQNRRLHERELLRVGMLYAHALADFRASSPGSLKAYPNSLEELLLDPRYLGVRRHLRRLYPDPIDPTQPWGLTKDADGHITGVYSQSVDEPVAEGPMDMGDLVLAPARHYSDWKFSLPIPS